MTTTTQTYSYRELHQAYSDLLVERDDLLVKLAQERQLKSDLQKTVNVLEEQVVREAMDNE